MMKTYRSLSVFLIAVMLVDFVHVARKREMQKVTDIKKR